MALSSSAQGEQERRRTPIQNSKFRIQNLEFRISPYLCGVIFLLKKKDESAE
jgi:hypothetical protein